ncbi:hypothetical protein [Geodermatophilus sp. Leaf369]|uniref:hypothetical protein n=1 Tax=Geodermatophilus sp. Leaf369 TaxID=1736354 RepID=UPI001910B24E|nr:hypothetical protein [Geodermatophilus sp. Leaf369]
MTETPRPVPGPLRPTPAPVDGAPDLAARLAGLPVAEHAAEFELAHAHLQRRLATIDQL